jgi:tetratricopeptide (TPR) repeat protein/ADP-heptose:LPS heptosyltransferase
MRSPCLILLALAATSCKTNVNEEYTFYPTENYLVAKKKPVVIEQSFEELFNHGNDLFFKDNYLEAAETYQKAIDLNPTSHEAFFNKGQALYWAKKYPEALEAYKKTIFHNKNHTRAYIQIGKLLVDVKQSNDAIIPLKTGIALEPKNNADARLLLARCYNEKRLYTDALDTVEQGITYEPNHINLLFERANIYNAMNKMDEALALYKELDQQVPHNPSIIYNIGFTYKKLGLLVESLPYYEEVLRIQPTHADALFSRGLAYLMLGDFEKGWEGYEWRYSKPEGALRDYNAPRWDGSDLNGKTILLHAEQGFGDTFQFIRYAKLIKEKHGTVIAAVQKALVNIIGLCPYVDIVVNQDDTLPPFDVQASLMSLPHILKTKFESLPAEIPYLFADEKLTDHWKEELAKDKNFKIGVCWQGNSNYATPQLRTAVALKSIEAQQLAPLCLPGVSLYSLQKMTGTDQVNQLSDDVKIITFDGNFDQSNGRFMDTAAVMKNLDLIITVDTSICHLASGLGVPTWVMLPNPPDWRWMLDRSDSPWYPTIRLFRQPTPGDWESVVQMVAKELKQLVEKNT